MQKVTGGREDKVETQLEARLKHLALTIQNTLRTACVSCRTLAQPSAHSFALPRARQLVELLSCHNV
eukprot:16143743-Heterocapsa_arctica.AAC.1